MAKQPVDTTATAAPTIKVVAPAMSSTAPPSKQTRRQARFRGNRTKAGKTEQTQGGKQDGTVAQELLAHASPPSALADPFPSPSSMCGESSVTTAPPSEWSGASTPISQPPPLNMDLMVQQVERRLSNGGGMGQQGAMQPVYPHEVPCGYPMPFPHDAPQWQSGHMMMRHDYMPANGQHGEHMLPPQHNMMMPPHGMMTPPLPNSFAGPFPPHFQGPQYPMHSDNGYVPIPYTNDYVPPPQAPLPMPQAPQPAPLQQPCARPNAYGGIDYIYDQDVITTATQQDHSHVPMPQYPPFQPLSAYEMEQHMMHGSPYSYAPPTPNGCYDGVFNGYLNGSYGSTAQHGVAWMGQAHTQGHRHRHPRHKAHRRHYQRRNMQAQVQA
jgi:hypothetical protein